MPVSTLRNSCLIVLLMILSGTVFAQSAGQEWEGYREAFERGERHANVWQAGWAGVYGASLAFNTYQASEASDRDDRYDARVGVVKSALALGGTLLDHQPHPEARRQFEQLRKDDDLDRARALILDTAAEERERRALRARLGSLVVNSASGLLIGLGDGRGRDGAINFATGMLISELQLQTQPGQASIAVNRFQPSRITLGELHFDYEYALLVSPEQVGVAIRY